VSGGVDHLRFYEPFLALVWAAQSLLRPRRWICHHYGDPAGPTDGGPIPAGACLRQTVSDIFDPWLRRIRRRLLALPVCRCGLRRVRGKRVEPPLPEYGGQPGAIRLCRYGGDGWRHYWSGADSDDYGL